MGSIENTATTENWTLCKKLQVQAEAQYKLVWKKREDLNNIVHTLQDDYDCTNEHISFVVELLKARSDYMLYTARVLQGLIMLEKQQVTIEEKFGAGCLDADTVIDYRLAETPGIGCGCMADYGKPVLDTSFLPEPLFKPYKPVDSE